jgi:hypothetical protein
MAHYRYEGLAPADDGGGGLLRPLDEREFDAPPGAPWRLIPEPQAPEKPAETPAEPAGPKVGGAATGAAPASTTPPKAEGTEG